MSEQEKNEIGLQVGELATKEDIGRTKTEFSDRIKEELSERIALAENHTPLIKRIDSLADEYKYFAGILTDVTTKISVIESKLNSIEKNYGKKAAETSQKMKEKIIIREPRFLEEQFKEIINRMIFLESRLIAVEGMMHSMHEKSRALPIIIE